MTEQTRNGRWRLDVDDDGWAGFLEVAPWRNLTWDGTPLPAITWHLPLYRAEALADALEVLELVADVTGARDSNASMPFGWAEEIDGLRKALQHLVDSGRAYWHKDGRITSLPSQEAAVDP